VQTSVPGLLITGVGVTTVFIGRLRSWHLFLGLVLIGPVALKVASTGYRFMRYYTAEPLPPQGTAGTRVIAVLLIPDFSAGTTGQQLFHQRPPFRWRTRPARRG
jgi:hypothetical protein